MKAVYIHLPFCANICHYCDFCKMLYNPLLTDKYLDALEIEIKQIYQGDPIKTIYIGGGTPSILSIDQLKRLFKIISIFDTTKLQEYTIECNVENITEEKIILFKKVGINRLSIGVQSFNDKLIKFLGRYHTKEIVFNTIKKVKELGIKNINIDMIYGINNQTMEDLKDDIDNIIKLDVTHVSFYSLIIEPNTKLYIDHAKDIDEDLNYEMYKYINLRLKSNEFNHYEISNYSKEGFESIHNLVYWHNEEYYGFGLGASSFINNVRNENTRNITKYNSGIFLLNSNTLTPKEMMQNEMILGLRLISGVNLVDFYRKYNKTIEEVFNINKIFMNGLLINKNNYLYIPEDKIFISNEVLIEFVD